MGGWVDKQMDGHTDGWMDGWGGEWVGVWVSGRLDGWGMNVWVEGSGGMNM